MSDNAGSDPSDDESDAFSDDESDASESDEDFDPSEVFLYTGEEIVIPRNVRRAEVHCSVEDVPDCLFQNCLQLESVLLHEGLLGIGDFAFLDCSSLLNFRCPSTVTDIGRGAFWGCSNLATIKLPEGLDSIESLTFCDCTSLEEAQIPASVALIGRSAFFGCRNLVSLGLHEGLRTIGRSAFGNCLLLASLSVPSSVEEIGERAFNGCSSLISIQIHENLPTVKWGAFRGCPSGSFRFAPLSDHTGAIRMDNETKSMFESRLREITLALTGEDRDDEGEDDSDNEGDAEAVREKCKDSLERAHEVLTYLELKGAVPVLELALWKAKIEGQGEEGVRGVCVNNEEGGQDLSDAGRDRKRPKVTKNIGQETRLSREDSHVKCGAGIVIPEVLKFFTYRSSWPRLDDSEGANVH